MVEPVNQGIFLNWNLITVANAIKDKEVANYEQAY
jgi:hypothetical protein